MKKKELMKFMAVMLSASMIAGSGVPVTAADFSVDEIAVEAETEETQEETDEAQTDVSSDEDGADASGLDFGDTFSNEEAVPAVGDDGTTDDAKNAAAEYLKANYVDKNKIISNGGNAVVKSEDGLSYSVGYKMLTGSKSEITSMRLKTESSSSTYKSGWYINSEWVKWGSKTPSSPGSLGINRPTADQGPQTFKATLRLFSSDTAADVINDETQAATAALAT